MKWLETRDLTDIVSSTLYFDLSVTAFISLSLAGTNDLNASQMVANIYPTLDAALLSSMRLELEPSAPAEDSDEDNANVVLPSYDDVISGKV